MFVARRRISFVVAVISYSCDFSMNHTTGHISYYSTDEEENPVGFTGDTLFVAGCGKFFKSTTEQMYKFLCITLGSLPKPTQVYCANEAGKLEEAIAVVNRNKCSTGASIFTTSGAAARKFQHEIEARNCEHKGSGMKTATSGPLHDSTHSTIPVEGVRKANPISGFFSK